MRPGDLYIQRPKEKLGGPEQGGDSVGRTKVFGRDHGDISQKPLCAYLHIPFLFPREGSVCLQACVCELTRTHRHALLCASADPHVHMPSAATQPLNKHCSGPACPGRPERQSLKASQVPLRLKGRCEGQRGSQEIDPVLAQRKVMTNLPWEVP